MNKKIVSFGDSFVRGTEIENNDDCLRAWPALAAKQLSADYETCGVIACGNENIARQIYEYFSTNSRDNTLAIVNWTWGMRWDFYLPDPGAWVTLGPTCVPGRLQQHLDNSNAEQLIDFYQTYTRDSADWNNLRSLQAMWSAIQFLEHYNIPVVHTYMDREIFSKKTQGDRLEHYNNFRDPSWPNISDESELSTLPSKILEELNQDYHREKVPAHISHLQNLVLPYMETWAGDTFLEWSHKNHYPVTPSPGDHPLEEAHIQAANFWHERYQTMLSEL